MACIQPPPQHDLPDIWLRCERFPVRSPSFAIFSSQPAIADDKITLSFEFAKICQAESSIIVLQSRLDNAKLFHLVDILFIIHRESPDYILKSQNCWFFTGNVIGAMRCAQQTWVIKPKKTILKKLLQKLDFKAGRISHSIQQCFFDHWVDRTPSSGALRALKNREWLTPSYQSPGLLAPVSSDRSLLYNRPH